MSRRIRKPTLMRALLLLAPLLGLAAPGRAQPTVQDPPFPITTQHTNPFAMASAGGFLWFTESNAPNIGKVDTAGNITEIPVGTSSTYIAADPDGGSVWFGALSNLTTAGIVTNFPLIGVGNQGIAFTQDARGSSIWLTQGDGVAQVDKSNPSSGTTFYQVPSVTTTYAATTGSDGNIWFIERDHYNTTTDLTGRIAKVDLSRLTGCGTPQRLPQPVPHPSCITEYPVPGGEGTVGSTLVLGHDGAIWFKGFEKVGRITTSGAITVYDRPGTPGANQLTLGPDNALWYAAGSIGRIDTTDGSVTAIPVPGNGAGPGITAGPDGNIWFTSASYIGRVNLAGAPPPAPVRGGVIPIPAQTPVVINPPH
jgi:streptogramin lyase